MNIKTNRLITAWIAICSVLYTGWVSLQTIGRSYFRLSSRQWVDAKIQQWTKKILNLAKIRYRVINPHHIVPPKNRPVIIMCNHSSLYDIPLSFLAFPNHSVRMLAKKELSRIPFMNIAMRAAEFPFIDRHHRQQAIQDLQRVKQSLNSGIILWLAPEGTRSKTGKLGVFKKGGFITAIEMQAIIIPVGIRGASTILPAQTFRLNLNQSAEVHIGKPVDAAAYTVEERDQLIFQVRDSMLELVGEKTEAV